MLLNCALGLNTPPVGSTAVCGLRDWRCVGRAGDALDCALLCGALLVTLLAVTYVPMLSLALPAWVWRSARRAA